MSFYTLLTPHKALIYTAICQSKADPSSKHLYVDVIQDLDAETKRLGGFSAIYFFVKFINPKYKIKPEHFHGFSITYNGEDDMKRVRAFINQICLNSGLLPVSFNGSCRYITGYQGNDYHYIFTICQLYKAFGISDMFIVNNLLKDFKMPVSDYVAYVNDNIVQQQENIKMIPLLKEYEAKAIEKLNGKSAEETSSTPFISSTLHEMMEMYKNMDDIPYV